MSGTSSGDVQSEKPCGSPGGRGVRSAEDFVCPLGRVAVTARCVVSRRRFLTPAQRLERCLPILNIVRNRQIPNGGGDYEGRSGSVRA